MYCTAFLLLIYCHLTKHEAENHPRILQADVQPPSPSSATCVATLWAVLNGLSAIPNVPRAISDGSCPSQNSDTKLQPSSHTQTIQSLSSRMLY